MKALLIAMSLMTISFSSHAVLTCDMYKVRTTYGSTSMYAEYYLTSSGHHTLNSNGAISAGNPTTKAQMEECFTVGTFNYINKRIKCECVRNAGVDEALLAEKIATVMQQRNDTDFKAHKEETLALHANLVAELGGFLERFSKFLSDFKN